MTYAVKQDLIDRFGEEELIQLTDRSGTGFVDDAVLDRALADAGEEIDSYAGARYDVPLAAPLPSRVVRVACDIARHNLHGNGPPEPVRKAYEDARAWLREVAAGRAQLQGAATPAATSAAAQAQMESAERVFRRDDNGFI